MRRIPEGGAQYSLLCNERGGVLDDLFTYRLAETRFLTVTNAANHETRPGLDASSRRRVRRRHRATVMADFAMLAVQGPDARALVEAARRRTAAAAVALLRAQVAGAAALVCGTGYTGEDGVELLVDPDDAARVWDALVGRRRAAGRARRPRHAAARGLLPPLRQRPRARTAIRSRPGSAGPARRQTGFIGAEAISQVRASGPELKLVPFVIDGPGIARQGNPVCSDGGGEVDQRQLLAEPGARDRDGVRSSRRGPSPGPGFRSMCAARIRDAVVETQAPVPKGTPEMADAHYPDDLKYHAEHDWARIEGDEATFGITWYAQDTLGEVVFFTPPAVGAAVTKDEQYTEVESVKAVSDVVAPLSGEVIAVNDDARRQPGDDQRGPLRRGLAGPGQAVGPERGRQR